MSAHFYDLIDLWTNLYAAEPLQICRHVFSGMSVQKAFETSSGFNVPSEIAIVNFSWSEGIAESKFHRFIKPEIPRGFRADALTESAIHKIPPEGGPNCTENFDMIASEIQKYISFVGNRAFVFSKESEYDIVRDALKYIDKRVQTIDNFSNITVVKITDLFLALKWWNIMDHSSKSENKPTPSQIEIENAIVVDCLSRSCYTFKSNIRCDFHKKLDVAFCSLSTASLFWLHLTDYLVEHYPENEKINVPPAVPKSPPPIVRNSTTNVDSSSLMNNLDLSPKISKVAERQPKHQMQDNSAVSVAKIPSLASIVWTDSTSKMTPPSAAVASKRNLKSLPPLSTVNDKSVKTEAEKYSSPFAEGYSPLAEVIDLTSLVLPASWSRDLKRSKEVENAVASSDYSPPSLNDGVFSNLNQSNLHISGLARNPGTLNGDNSYPTTGHGRGIAFTALSHQSMSICVKKSTFPDYFRSDFK